ncbi:DHH family phosphoesterase [Enterococcus sp. CSURQ0835]|uniref:DHH family phosphoesterase n=1 Tax=Enterococcus sp. CSURQ0835 TaxID=2681394 RepID=UPI00135B1C4D|nr:bifunctional oligoribonuclease/PAP phosphatase NrnA [Enterococcus sp. CSURQ0835]
MDIQTAIMEMIKQYDRIIIHRHKRPDPDALGSQCGLAEILRASFPQKEIYQVGGPVEGLEFLATMDVIDAKLYQGALVIVTDTANSPRISDDRYALGEKLIKIDHHPNDEPYGDLVYVDTKTSSCSEIIADFANNQAELKLTAEAARLLYGGIVGDTGRFLYPSTSAHTLRVAADLLTYDFDAPKLNREIEQIPMKVAKLSGYVYEHLEGSPSGAAKVILPTALLEEFEVVDSETSALVPLPGVIDEVLAWALFVEQPEGYFRVRLRSKGPVINELAKKHHGGGHPLASGANASDLNEVAVIFNELQALCEAYKKA